MENKYWKFIKDYWKPLLAALIILLFLIYFLSGSVLDWWNNRQVLNELKAKDKQIEVLNNQVGNLEAEKEAAINESKEFKNAADTAINEKKNLEGQLKQLSKDMEPVQKELQDIRNGKRSKPTATLDERIINLKSKLDRLYPDNP